LNILLPPVSLLEKLSPQIKSISETIYSRTKEIQTLMGLRDWLLPMLMNGQVKVV
jgi:type I restriction enzyme S subunit